MRIPENNPSPTDRPLLSTGGAGPGIARPVPASPITLPPATADMPDVVRELVLRVAARLGLEPAGATVESLARQVAVLARVLGFAQLSDLAARAEREPSFLRDLVRVMDVLPERQPSSGTRPTAAVRATPSPALPASAGQVGLVDRSVIERFLQLGGAALRPDRPASALLESAARSFGFRNAAELLSAARRDRGLREAIARFLIEAVQDDLVEPGPSGPAAPASPRFGGRGPDASSRGRGGVERGVAPEPPAQERRATREVPDATGHGTGHDSPARETAPAGSRRRDEAAPSGDGADTPAPLAEREAIEGGASGRSRPPASVALDGQPAVHARDLPPRDTALRPRATSGLGGAGPGLERPAEPEPPPAGAIRDSVERLAGRLGHRLDSADAARLADKLVIVARLRGESVDTLLQRAADDPGLLKALDRLMLFVLDLAPRGASEGRAVGRSSDELGVGVTTGPDRTGSVERAGRHAEQLLANAPRLLGLDLGDREPERLASLLSILAELRGLTGVEQLLLAVPTDPVLRGILRDALAGGARRFAEDPVPFVPVRDQLVTASSSNRSVRVWNPGCRLGIDAYSIGMAALQHGPPEATQILGTDSDPELVAFARAGRYDMELVESLDPAVRERFFAPEGHDGAAVHVAPELERIVTFREHDLVGEPIGETFDLVVCRGVLGFLSLAARRRAQRHLVDGTRPGGMLVVGSNDPAPDSDLGLRPLGEGRYVRLDAGERLVDVSA